MADSEDGPKVVFKKMSNFTRKRGAMRRELRKDSSESEGKGSSEGEETKIVSRHKKKRTNPMVQSTSGVSQRKKEKADISSSGTDSEAEDRAKLLSGTQYQSAGPSSRVGPQDMGATATYEIDTEIGKDAQAQFERAQEAIKETRGKADDKVYRGLNTYGQFKEKRDTAAGNAASGMVRKGPVRAPANVRQTVRWDYQPDLCKDYKETGFCGFGDSCKFLHDRTDYKHGWEIERDWEAGRYGKDDEDPGKYEISDDEDELPFKCFICRESFTNPIITKCRHYFCEKCALEHYRTTQKCYICEKNTGGIFNPAKELVERLKAEGEGGGKKKKGGESDSSKESEGEEDTPMQTIPTPHSVSEHNNSDKNPQTDSD